MGKGGGRGEGVWERDRGRGMGGGGCRGVGEVLFSLADGTVTRGLLFIVFL